MNVTTTQNVGYGLSAAMPIKPVKVSQVQLNVLANGYSVHGYGCFDAHVFVNLDDALAFIKAEICKNDTQE